MRIIVICGAPYVSGKEKIMLVLMNSFKNKGHVIFCITSKWNDGMFTDSLKKNNIPFKELYIGFLSFVLKWKVIKMVFDQFLHLPQLYINYRRAIKQFKPDIIIHTNFHTTFSLFPLLKNSTFNIYHSHESIINSQFYRILFKLFNKRIAYFIGVSNFVSNRLIELGLPAKKVKTIHNGLEIDDRIYPQTTSSFIRIGIAGQVAEWKGHEDLIDALGILKRSTQNFKCYIYGSGNINFKETISSKISILAIDDFVEWKGYVKKQAHMYRDIDIMVVPSRSEEPFATSALEPYIYNIPVISSSQGGLPEIIIDGVTGFLVPSHSPEILANKLKILINNSELRLKMGQAGRKRISQFFNINISSQKWEELFILNKKK